MKKILAIMMVIMMTFSMTACGNYEMFDMTYEYDYAIIQLPNGEIVEGDLDKWTDYEGEQLQVTIDGNTYLVSSINATLIKYAEKGE